MAFPSAPRGRREHTIASSTHGRPFFGGRSTGRGDGRYLRAVIGRVGFIRSAARISLKKRKLLVQRVVEEDWSLSEAARAAEVSERTARKWVRRFLAEGETGLLDRLSTPRHIHNRTPEDRVQVIAALRRLRFTGPEIAELLEMVTSTVSAVLKRIDETPKPASPSPGSDASPHCRMRESALTLRDG